MTTQQQYIERLKEMVEQKLGRGIASIDDCSMLGDAVREATNKNFDANDYAALFFPKSNVAPRPAILSALTRYVGYENWSSFCSSADVLPAEDRDIIPTPRRWGVFILTLAAIIVVVVTAIILLHSGSETETAQREVDAVVEEVEERWLARTHEKCNALRAYSEEKNYSSRIDAFVAEYGATLCEDITSELRTMLQDQNITLSEERISAYAEAIKSQCFTMCETLHQEIAE